MLSDGTGANTAESGTSMFRDRPPGEGPGTSGGPVEREPGLRSGTSRDDPFGALSDRQIAAIQRGARRGANRGARSPAASSQRMTRPR